MMKPEAMYSDDLSIVLAIEEIDRNLYRGINTTDAPSRTALYGGQVAAQALMAAGLTVGEDRLPHSLHGYFLRPGRTDLPVLLHVDRDRDGRSFSARHVSAMQDGEVIFSMLASFHTADADSALDAMPPSDVKSPEECSPYPIDSLVDVREVTITEVVDGHQLYSDCLWMKSKKPLPKDRLTHACALTYLSDLGSGFGRMTTGGNGGPSLDHAVWFHEPVLADEWVLLHMWPKKATHVRGLYDGTMRDRNGRLGGVIAQENLLLHRPPG